MKRLRLFAGLAVVALSALASVTVAQASTPIGQTGPPDSTTYQPANGGVEIITPSYVVPAGGGTIVSLNTQSSQCILQPYGIPLTLGQYDLQVLRPMPGGQYQMLGHTGNKIDPCNGQLVSYPVNIPVQAGDVLGVYVVNDWMGVITDFPGGNPIVYNFTSSEPTVNDIITVTNPYSKTMDESATLVQVPTSTSQCKNDGWQLYVDNNGNPFKNQGDCVSFVATKGKNGGNG
jgi:hypothetical protein